MKSEAWLWWNLHSGKLVKPQLTCHCACEAGHHLHSLHVLQESGKSARAAGEGMHRTVSRGLQQGPWQTLSPEVKLHPQRHRAAPADCAFQRDPQLTTLLSCRFVTIVVSVQYQASTLHSRACCLRLGTCTMQGGSGMAASVLRCHCSAAALPTCNSGRQAAAMVLSSLHLGHGQ